ncbi:hypothetical protein ACFS5N_14010 [Mucilaginibacter ximonensis]|uniref:Uncharacterized protein n=1 Tax=Mucilaginibacter ximonensis TaxID=538021 RepID=A0ABW5YE93_9SPHI
MKNLILLIVITCLTTATQAQTRKRVQTTVVDGDLKFEPPLTACEREWVVLKKADTSTSYTFGYVFIDGDQSFMFQRTGTFVNGKVGKRNKYMVSQISKTEYYKPEPIYSWVSFQLGYSPPPRVAVISAEHFKELGIPAEPDWVKPYYNYIDTLEHILGGDVFMQIILCLTKRLPVWKMFTKNRRITPAYK